MVVCKSSTRLSHVGPSEGCLDVRAVWKARPYLNPAGIRVTGVMNPGLGSGRPRDGVTDDQKYRWESFLGWKRYVCRAV